MKTLDDFLALVAYYEMKAASGVYYNPYDVENELLDILRKTNTEPDERIRYEDIAHDTGILFWDM